MHKADFQSIESLNQNNDEENENDNDDDEN